MFPIEIIGVILDFKSFPDYARVVKRKQGRDFGFIKAIKVF